MIGDKISVKKHHYPPAREIIAATREAVRSSDSVFSYGIGGESGSGKSTLSLALRELLQREEGLNSFIFHMDDYYKQPPEDTHRQREQSLSKVGPEEVDLERLEKHIRQVKKGADRLRKPLVHYRENVIREVIVELDAVDVVIAEGTYCTLLEPVDCRIFMLRSYKETYDARRTRGRDPTDPLIEKVLEFEHNLIRGHAERADILVDREYRVRVVGQQP